jgi:transposase InsO family protein
VVESFFSTLKHVLDVDADAPVLQTLQQLQRQLAFWIDGYYNRERRHSTIGYLRPIDHVQQYIAARTLTTARPSSLSIESGQPHLGRQFRKATFP